MALRQFCSVALPFVALVAFFLVITYLPTEQQSSFDVKPDHSVNIDCDISNKVCPIRLGDLTLTVSLSPSGLPALTPLHLLISDASFALQDTDSWLVWFAGRDMDMGAHLMTRDAAAKHPIGVDNDAPFLAKYTGIIPVCSVDSAMTWLLNIQFVWRSEVYRFTLPASAMKT